MINRKQFTAALAGKIWVLLYTWKCIPVSKGVVPPVVYWQTPTEQIAYSEMLSGLWLKKPSENMSSSPGIMKFTIDGKHIKIMFQTTNQ